MHQSDFDEFSKIMQRLALVFTKSISDPMVEEYWNSLKDLPLSVVTSRAERHKRYERFFPKPIQLRPDEGRAPIPLDGLSKAAEERAMRRLEEQRRDDPSGWLKILADYDPNCLALQLASKHGTDGIWYDIPKRAWRSAS
jgi:hypothetical protein